MRVKLYWVSVIDGVPTLLEMPGKKTSKQIKLDKYHIGFNNWKQIVPLESWNKAEPNPIIIYTPEEAWQRFTDDARKSLGEARMKVLELEKHVIYGRQMV